MIDLLQTIVAARRRQIADWVAAHPLPADRRALPPSDRDFAAALRARTPAFILECKQASPSQGLIRAAWDLDSIARVFARYASALSVLTEPDHFRGSFENLRRLRTLCPQPLLCKDFITQLDHVHLARAHGADAILLILAVLSDRQYRELADAAAAHRMAVLTEVATPQEAARAVTLGAAIVGINNRNLRDGSIDLARTPPLAATLAATPLLISESGLSSHAHVRALSPSVDGFLVGGALMAQPDLSIAVRRLIFGDHKVCGLTRREDADVAGDAGAVFGGLIFAPSSPRRVTIEQAAQVIADRPLRPVGVFQDQPLDEIVGIAHALQLAAVQLHGREPLAFIEQLRRALPDHVEIWKAVSVDQIERWQSAPVQRLIVESAAAEGGSGRTWDWNRLPTRGRSRLILAGGLGPEHAAAAAAIGCGGLDFNSAVEDAPGVKNHERVRLTFQRLRLSGGRRHPAAEP